MLRKKYCAFSTSIMSTISLIYSVGVDGYNRSLHMMMTFFSIVLLTVCFVYSMCNSGLLFVSHCFALSWPGRSCKWELVLNWPTWLNKESLKKYSPWKGRRRPGPLNQPQREVPHLPNSFIAKVQEEAQLAAAQISARGTLLSRAQDAATPCAECFQDRS